MRNEDRLFLTLPAQGESLSHIRSSVESHCQRIGISQATVVDLKIVVSEACANVVLHAYGDPASPGPLEVELIPGEAELSAVVRDFGAGIRPRSAPNGASFRMGLAIIGALSNRFQLISTHSCGTELRADLTRA